jgi:hypothetical protein
VDDTRLREAIGRSIDRAAIHTVLLRKIGQPAGGLLPQWISGYAFLFPTAREVTPVAAAAPLILSHDPGDPISRAIAGRVAVNARDAGIRLHVAAQAPRPDLRLVRTRIRSSDPAAALSELGVSAESSPEARYAAERQHIESFQTVPIVHLPDLYGSTERLRSWNTPGLTKTGAWRFEDLWMAAP